jgi:hypothetical protein
MITKTYLTSLGIHVAEWPKDTKAWKLTPVPGVFCTAGNQIVGSFSDLDRFRDKNTAYFGWHRHHIVESRDLERLGIADHLPDRDEQLCVLLPAKSHGVRINLLDHWRLLRRRRAGDQSGVAYHCARYFASGRSILRNGRIVVGRGGMLQSHVRTVAGDGSAFGAARSESAWWAR